MADAGFHEVQPGIEADSHSVLRSMRKGVRGIDNVSLLKAGYANGVIIDYNILYGLPSDTAEVYAAMIEAIPRLYHLTPPISRNETVVTRFAPLQVSPARFGVTSQALHHACYDVLFSKEFLRTTGFSLDSYAYYFGRNFQYAEYLEVSYAQLRYQVDHWKEQHRLHFVELSYFPVESCLQITDTRYGSADTYVLNSDRTIPIRV